VGYSAVARPFKIRTLPNSALLAISESGDHTILTGEELDKLNSNPELLPLDRQADLLSRFFLRSGTDAPGSRRLLSSRRNAKRETVQGGPSLHIIVPTLQCAHSCRYCQVSRALDDAGHTLSLEALNAACDTIFCSPSSSLTVEFQGGDPLLRYDLVEHAIRRIADRNASEQRKIRFVVASTLHQLTADMCAFFARHDVCLSTSVDGPSVLHNRNRPTPSRDAYERTVAGIELARSLLGHDAVSALMTTTKASLAMPEDIVDDYVRLGFRDIFLRPLSAYGFAKRNQATQAYSQEDFQAFYQRALERVLRWNRLGVPLREVYASIILNKILSPFDSGYVDLQSPTGAGLSVLVYNYDGFVYPSDEARMLAETGDVSLRLGRIGGSLPQLLNAPIQRDLIRASLTAHTPGCRTCAYNQFCAPNPVDSQAQFGTPYAPVASTEHCQRHIWLFDMFYMRLQEADDATLDLFHEWAQPAEMSQR
jgi:His-Xaa-Ser system radical SAM maturase HxsB